MWWLLLVFVFFLGGGGTSFGGVSIVNRVAVAIAVAKLMGSSCYMIMDMNGLVWSEPVVALWERRLVVPENLRDGV